MSGQENTPASTGQGPLVSTKGSNTPFALLADNGKNIPDYSSMRQKASGCPAPSQPLNAHSRPLQPSLPDVGLCVYMLADWASAEYRVSQIGISGWYKWHTCHKLHCAHEISNIPDVALQACLLHLKSSVSMQVRKSPNCVYDLITQITAPGEPPQCKFTLVPKV